MRALLSVLLMGGLAAVLAGCASVGSVATSDSAAMLREATDQFERRDNPQTAEKLIREAMERYQTNNDQLGLANAYRTYGFFFRSAAVEGKWAGHYRENGFLDKSANFDTRYEQSIAYFEKARIIFAKYERFDALTTVNLNIGFTYEAMGYQGAACEAFDRSMQSNRETLQPSQAKVILPQGVSTYEEFLAPHLQRAGCSEQHKGGRKVVRAA
jgi:tetratricopeptide (TPR) repeat protein